MAYFRLHDDKSHLELHNNDGLLLLHRIDMVATNTVTYSQHPVNCIMAGAEPLKRLPPAVAKKLFGD